MKADIFFFITALAVILVTLLAVWVLWYLTRILKNISYISDRARKEVDVLVEDIATIRIHAKEKGLDAIDWVSWFRGGAKKKKRSSKFGSI